MAEIETIEKDVTKIIKDPKKRIFILAGVVVILLILFIRSRSNNTIKSSGIAEGDLVSEVNSLLEDTIKNVSESQADIVSYFETRSESQDEKIEGQYGIIESVARDIYKVIESGVKIITPDYNRSDVTYENTATPTKYYNQDLILRLEADIARVSAKASDPDTISYFSRNYGSIEGYLASQKLRLITAKEGYLV